MDNLVSGKRFSSLLDAVAADDVGIRPSTAGDGMGPDTSGLGPSVGDDSLAPTSPSATRLGPSVGDDTNPAPSAPSVTMLGPSVGDDRAPSPAGGTTLGPSLADDSSDLRLKDDVRCIGTTVFGLPLYQFKYIGAPETYEGVMAQDVLQVMPSAVSRGVDGYYRVNYGALGTSMRRVS